MKLYEIMNFTPSAAMKQTPTQVWDKIESKMKKLGSGAYATVYSVPGDVEKAQKVGVAPTKTVMDDGYLAFLKTIQHMNNPHLPQVDAVKVKHTPFGTREGKYLFHVRTEKLVDRDHVSEDEVVHMIDRYAPNPQHYYKGARQEAAIMKHSLAQEYLKRFAKFLADHVRGYANVPIRDKNLREAIGVVAELVKAGYHLDLHSRNIMFRRTPHGLVPVITDPLEPKSLA